MEIPDYISEVVMPVDPFVKVALLLPFSAKDYPVFVDTLVEKMPVQISARSEQFISFYEGVLLAVDSLKNQGYKVNLKVFDTERSAEKMYTMVDKIDRFHPDLIIDRENIIILPTTKEAEVSKILPVLSALTDGYRITVVGFPEWQAFTSVDHETYFKLNTKIFTYSYVDNTTEPAKRFALKYRKYFYTEPNNLAYKAFDMSLYFIELAAKYRDRTLDALEFYPRNGDFSRFYFQKMEGQAGKENQGFYIVNFGSDYRLKIESL